MRIEIVTITLLLCFPFLSLAQSASPDALTKRNEAYREELEQYFRDYLVEQYPQRASRLWNRSYHSQEAFLRSVAPNRERYRKMFSPPSLVPTGPIERKPMPHIEGVEAVWLTIPLGRLKAAALP